MKEWELHLGDALEVLAGIDPANIDAVIVDPPFGIRLEPFSARRRKDGAGWSLPGDNTQVIGEAVCAWAMSHRLPLIAFAHPGRPWPGDWQQYLVWDKGPGVGIGGGKTRPWKPTWELIQTANIRHYNGTREAAVLKHWVGDPGRSFAHHPCQKPLPLMRRLVKKITRPGDMVLDPCAGSGSTGVACLQTDRRFIGVEVNPAYHAVALKRLADVDGPLFAQAVDNDPDAAASMTPEARAELERLHEEFERGLAEDGGVWPVYTGDGE